MKTDYTVLIKMEQNETIPITVAYNQNVENAGVAFVKGANERNELFKKKKPECIANESGRTRQMTNNLRNELIRG